MLEQQIGTTVLRMFSTCTTKNHLRSNIEKKILWNIIAKYYETSTISHFKYKYNT